MHFRAKKHFKKQSLSHSQTPLSMTLKIKIKEKYCIKDIIVIISLLFIYSYESN